MDGFVALYRWILAAKTAPKHGCASAWTNYAISIPTTFRYSLPSGLPLCACGNTEILALWILTEVNLNRGDFHRDTFIELVWSFEQKNPPTRFYPIGRQMLRSFQHVKRSARQKWPCLFCFHISSRNLQFLNMVPTIDLLVEQTSHFFYYSFLKVSVDQFS